VALGPLVGVYCRATVADGMQKYHPIPVRLTGFIRLWPRYRVIQRLQYIIIGGGGGWGGGGGVWGGGGGGGGVVTGPKPPPTIFNHESRDAKKNHESIGRTGK